MEAREYEQMLWNLMSPENSVRNHAEMIFENMKADSDSTLLPLLQVIRSNLSDDVRSLAAVLLRRVLIRDEVSLWTNASADTQNRVKTDLLHVLTYETNPSIRRKLCDTVGELASSILEEGEWEELLPCMFQWITSANVAHRESALRVFEMISMYIATCMTAYFDTTIQQLFQTSLRDIEGHVALHALRALGMLTLSLDELEERDRFQPLLPSILYALQAMHHDGKEDDLVESMEVLIELLEPHASFFKPILKELVPIMVVLVSTGGEGHFGRRQLAMEVLVSVAENAPSACRRFPQNSFVEQVFPLAFHLMLDVSEDESDLDEADAEDISNVDVGAEALQRMAQAIGFKKALPVSFNLVSQYAGQNDWKYQYAALMALTQIVEIVPSAQLHAVVKHVFARVHPEGHHPKVVSVALDAIGQLASDHGPLFQEQYHEQTVAVLLEYMQRREGIPLKWSCHFQTHALTSLRYFIDTCNPDIVEPYLDSLLAALFALLNAPPTVEGRPVQEHAVAALSSIAGCCGESFGRYFSMVFPPLKQLLYSSLHELQQESASSSGQSTMLCGITLECLSLVGLAVGAPVFGAHATEILDVMTQMQHSTQYAHDDILRSYLLQAWARWCKALTNHFAPYLPVVMPSLLDAAMQQAEFEMEQDEMDDMDETDDDDDVQIAQVNDKCVSIRTSILEEKATACQMLSSMVADLKDAFFPYVEQVTQVLTPLMTDSVHTEIRAASIQAMPWLVLSVSKHLHDASAPTLDSLNPVVQMLEYTLGRLLNALSTEPELDLQMTIMQSIKMCILHAVDPLQKSPTATSSVELLNHAQLSQLVEGLLIVLAESFQRRAVRRARKAIEELDEEENEEDLDNDATEAQLQFILADCLGSLAQTHPQRFFPVFQETLLDKVLEMVQPHCLPEDRKLAVYLVDDVLEHCEPSRSHLDTFVPILLNCVASDYPPLRQAASYGLSLCARLGQTAFTPYLNPAVELLWNLVHAADAWEPFMLNATDNAVSALGSMLLHFDSLPPTLFPQWLALLPLRGDVEESAALIQRLCAAAHAPHRLFAEDPSNVPRLLSLIAEILSLELFESNQPVFADMQSALHKLRTMVPDHVMKSVWQSMSSAQQAALHALFA
ncbi:hypothetical protein Ae201684P_003140 [Aphanomyces euteiches]|uniref:Importin N-terminal domain-containing protein n=1 Tax=Aphanomyces euteiches TaxID=100861 RepID=A0A6G0X2Q5_9STRA|nr:hypothetical protein Ae201684_009052 [Aphanomyces euteiches]KAH9073636.1 hypothetical protein Ae201684P_003140 [Aphanomyces euteiches]KAH9155947.1 hypothetical protein AeRB84_002111 [Aphanomyces euteiches]